MSINKELDFMIKTTWADELQFTSAKFEYIMMYGNETQKKRARALINTFSKRLETIREGINDD